MSESDRSDSGSSASGESSAPPRNVNGQPGPGLDSGAAAVSSEPKFRPALLPVIQAQMRLNAAIASQQALLEG